MTTTTYRRWVVPRRGGTDVLELAEAPLAEPPAGQLRVRTVAAGVAFGDIVHRRGVPGGFRPPYVPGYDVVGVVDAVGDDVAGFAVGQTVASLVMRGGYAESALCRARDAAVVPAGVDPAAAVAVVLNYVVAHQMLERVARIRPGQRILVHSAAGGVGTALLDLARLRGVEAIGTASGGKHDIVAGYGAEPIDYTRADFVARVAGAGGVDAAFDPIGGRHWLRSYRCLRRGGRLVMFGASSVHSGGLLPTVAALAGVRLRAALTRDRTTHWYDVVDRRTGRIPHLAEDLATMLDLLARKEIRPVIGARVPFDRAPAAQVMLEERAATGKVVLTFAGSAPVQ